MLTTIVLLGLSLVATATDLARHKIYNWTTYTGILMAVGLSAVGSLLGMSEERLRSLGWISTGESLWGCWPAAWRCCSVSWRSRWVAAT